MILTNNLVRQTVDTVASTTGANDTLVVGTGAAVLSLPEHADASLRETEAVDIVLGGRRQPPSRHGDSAAAVALDRQLGRGSQFHRNSGFFVRSLEPETSEWRSIPSPEGRVQWQLKDRRRFESSSLADVAYGKLNHGRPKDVTYVGVLIGHGYLPDESIAKRLARENQQTVRQRVYQNYHRANSFREFWETLETLRMAHQARGPRARVLKDVEQLIANQITASECSPVRASRLRLDARKYVEANHYQPAKAMHLFERLLGGRGNAISSPTAIHQQQLPSARIASRA